MDLKLIIEACSILLCTSAFGQVTFDTSKLPPINRLELSKSVRNDALRVADRQIEMADLLAVLEKSGAGSLSLQRCLVKGSATAGIYDTYVYPRKLTIDDVEFTGHAQFSSREAADWKMRHVTFRGDLALEGVQGDEVKILLGDAEVSGGLTVESCGAGQEFIKKAGPFALRSIEAPDFPSLDFERIHVHGASNFVRCNWANFICDDTSVIFDGHVTFDRLDCCFMSLEKTTFRKSVLFRHSVIACLRLDAAVFEDDLQIETTKFAEAFCVDGASLKTLRMPWGALSGEALFLRVPSAPGTRLRSFGGVGDGDLMPPSPQSWRTLEEAWRAGGDLIAANNALYERKVLEAPHSWERFIWGYGVRPWRPIGWACVVVLLFGLLYWVALRSNLPIGSGLERANAFSMRCAWKWSYGWKHTRPGVWRAIVLFEQLVFKALLVLIVKSAADSSPLLHTAIRLFVPGT